MMTKRDLLASAAHFKSLALSRHKLGVSFRSRRIAVAPIDKAQSEVYHALEQKHFATAARCTKQAALFEQMAAAIVESSDDQDEVQSTRHSRIKIRRPHS